MTKSELIERLCAGTKRTFLQKEIEDAVKTF